MPWYFFKWKEQREENFLFEIIHIDWTPWHTAETEGGGCLREGKFSRSRRQKHRSENLWCQHRFSMIYAHMFYMVTTQRKESSSFYETSPDRVWCLQVKVTRCDFFFLSVIHMTGLKITLGESQTSFTRSESFLILFL